MPFADVGPTLIPDWMDDEDAVLLTDALATGYFGAQLGDIVEGDVVVVFGAGPVGLFAAKSAWLMGAGRVIVIDHLEYRLATLHPDNPITETGVLSESSRHGFSSRFRARRADRAHQPLDPIIVGAPWVVLGGAAYVAARRVAGLRRGRGSRGRSLPG